MPILTLIKDPHIVTEFVFVHGQVRSQTAADPVKPKFHALSFRRPVLGISSRGRGEYEIWLLLSFSPIPLHNIHSQAHASIVTHAC